MAPSAAFTPDDLIACYRRGVFPMADARDDDTVYLVDPEERGVLPLESFHVPRRLARTVRDDPFEIRIDTAFERVVEACAAPRPGRAETWINRPIRRLYGELYARGQAHSVEAYWRGALVGGLYGVSLGAAFFGESMFSEMSDASKVSLIHLVARLKVGGYRLLDAQFMTNHLAQFGAREISRAQYQARLQAALAETGDFYRLATAGRGAGALQAISQTS